MISILIVHYNRPDLLVECLESLQDAEDIVVVDNGSLSVNAQQELSKNFEHVTWLFLENNLGFSAGVNRAAQAARGDVFFLLNPDTLVHGVSIRQLEAVFREEGAEVLGLRQVDGRGQVQLSRGWQAGVLHELFRKILQDGCDHDQKWAHWLLERVQKPSHSVDWVAGSALLTPRSVFEAQQGFDERYFLYFEDIDYCLRVSGSGGRIAFLDSPTLVHHRGACASTVAEFAQNHYRDSQRLFFRVHGSLWARLLMPAWSELRRRLRRP
jgi:N-acetylglucosaminyl-diphospho-decaprenol L-rhamnosyltransferase